MTDDATLLRRYAADRSEAAFAEFVHRHLPLVFATAARRLNGDVHAASDIAQAVFARAARDAASLARHPVVVGWLYTATRNAAADRVRAEARRAARERIAAEVTLMPSQSPLNPENLRSVLDAALDNVSKRDRELVLLRYFEGRSFPEIGATVGLTEEAARKRIERALERMRGSLARRRITSTAAALATAFAAEAAVAVPSGLAGSIIGAAAATTPAALAGATLMTITKLHAGLATAIVLGGAAGLVWQHNTITGLRATTAVQESRLAAAEAKIRTLARAAANAETEATHVRAEFATATQRAISNPAPAVAPPAAVAPAVPEPSAAAARDPQQIARLHARYDSFLQQRGLTPEQIARWIAAMNEKEQIRRDLEQAAHRYGADMRTPEFRRLYGVATAAQWRQMREILGPDGFTAFQDYERTSAYRSALNPLAPQLAAAGAPLSATQSDQLVQAIIANLHALPKVPTAMGHPQRINWSGVAQQASAFLTPAQQSVLTAFAARQHP